MQRTEWPPVKMFQAVNVPQDATAIHPWIERFLHCDVAEAKRLLDTRLATDHPALAPLVERMKEFTPCQVLFSEAQFAFSEAVGYVRCVRQYTEAETGSVDYDAILIAEPLSNETLEAKIAHFDQALRPTVRAFWTRFAGSGEEMEGTAGQVTFNHWMSAADWAPSFAQKHEEWGDAKLFYAAANGDSVFIKPRGETAWHTMETNALTPIADTLEQFIRIYAEFRRTPGIFDSWAYREFKSGQVS